MFNSYVQRHIYLFANAEMFRAALIGAALFNNFLQKNHN